MNLSDADEYPIQNEEDLSLDYEEADAVGEELPTTEEIENPKAGNPYQPSELSIACYGAPEADTAIEFLDHRYALEDEITLENGEKVRLQLTEAQKLKRDVIRNLSEARHNRKLFSQRLKAGAETLNLSTRQVRRLFKDWLAQGTAFLEKPKRADCEKPRRSQYWYTLSLKLYKEGNKGNCSMTRTEVAERVQDQIYEYTKLELQPEIAQLEATGLSGEALDLELSRLIEQRQATCKQQKQAIQQEIAKLKTKVSELQQQKLDTKAVHDRIQQLEEQKQATVAFEFWRKYGQPPSTRTVEIWLKPIEERMHQAANSRSPGWHGDRLTIRTRKGEAIEVTHSNQVWQIDHTKADVLLVDEDGVEIGRPILTTVIDCYSRCIVGYRLGLKAPSSLVVALALRHAILPKQYGSDYEMRCEWMARGTPRYVYTDGAKDFNFLEYVGDQLGFKAERREQPSQGGIVERPFRTLSELLSEAPGYTGPNVQKRPEGIEKVVKMTLRELDIMLARYFADTYNQRPDPRTRANPFAPEQSRMARWEAGLRTPPAIIQPRELDICLMQTDERIVYDDGYLKFENLLYKGENFGQYAGDTVFLRYDPRDITMLLVYRRQAGREKFLVRAYAVGLESDRLSVEEVKHSVNRLKQIGKKINNVAIREESIKRRKFFDSSKKKKKKTKNERRHAEETRVNPPPERYEEDQHKRAPKPPVAIQPALIEVSVSPPQPVIDEDEDYAIEVDDEIEQVNYNKLRKYGL